MGSCKPCPAGKHGGSFFTDSLLTFQVPPFPINHGCDHDKVLNCADCREREGLCSLSCWACFCQARVRFMPRLFAWKVCQRGFLGLP
jgi:hypothetical protein